MKASMSHHSLLNWCLEKDHVVLILIVMRTSFVLLRLVWKIGLLIVIIPTWLWKLQNVVELQLIPTSKLCLLSQQLMKAVSNISFVSYKKEYYLIFCLQYLIPLSMSVEIVTVLVLVQMYNSVKSMIWLNGKNMTNGLIASLKNVVQQLKTTDHKPKNPILRVSFNPSVSIKITDKTLPTFFASVYFYILRNKWRRKVPCCNLHTKKQQPEWILPAQKLEIKRNQSWNIIRYQSRRLREQSYWHIMWR